MKKLLILIFIILIYSDFYSQNYSPFVRFPALNSDGGMLAFSYQGDIWTVPAEGGEARRLTIHQAYESSPVWSPDDKFIAFSSSRWGNNDVFTIPAEGGMPFRLTYYSSGDNVTDWKGDDILFSTRREYRQVERETEIYRVKASGGTPERILNALGADAVYSPNKNFIAFTMGECRIAREEYRGSADRDIWVYNIAEDKYRQITDFNGQDYMPKWLDDNTLVYIGAETGVYNLYKVNIDEAGNKSGKEIKLTSFDEDGIHWLSVSGNGKTIAVERGTNIFTLNADGSDVKKVDIKIGADYRFDPVEQKSFSKNISEYSISPNGKYAAFSIHGEIFVTFTDKDKKKTVNVSDSPFRDKDPNWLSDTTLVFVSDRNGEFDIYMVSSSEENNSNLITALKRKIIQLTDTPEEEGSPIISPDGKKIAYTLGRGKLITADISSGGELSGEKTLLDGWAAAGGTAWSPDSKWLAYSLDDLNFNSEIYIQAADNSSKPINVSMHPKGDMSPVWSPDGSKLAFVSNRNNGDNDIWFVWLKKSDWQKSKLDWEDEEISKPEKDKKKDKKKDAGKEKTVEPIKIDFENIYERLVQVTSLAGDEGNPAVSKDGKTIYFTANNPPNKGRDLFSIKWNKEDFKVVTKGGINPYAPQLDRTGKNLFLLKSGGKLAKLKLSGNKLESIPFKAKMNINYVAELTQIFDEAWRVLRDGFYDPDFHGKDWNELRDKYRPMCLAASTKTDFQYMFNLMLGQLNASHMGLYGSGREKTQREITGLLGIEIQPVENGIEIKRVIPNSPADKETSRLNIGDVITGVNGGKVEPDKNFYSMLENSADEKIILSVVDKQGNTREVVIRPIAGYGNLLYDEWVKQRRKLVDKYSNGRLGYLHIQAMGWNSFERFERELSAAGNGKEGIVIDVRYNGGGWTTDYLMAILNVKQHAYTIPRGAADNLKKEHLKFRNYYPFAERLPFYPWTKPSIAICNAGSYSNAEIFSHAYKTLGIGTLVGEPTFGAVISTGGQRLIDGSFVRLPFRAWYVKATDKNMEWGPAVPDIIVDVSPDHKAKGKDEQLKAAVDELLKEINSK